MKQAAWAKLLEDDDVKRWYENLSRGSISTAKERSRILHRYMRAHDTTPKELVLKAREDKKSVEDELHDFVTKLDNEGKSPGYITNYVKAVRSWLDFNDIRLYRKIKIRDTSATPTIEDEQIPTRDELRTLFGSANERARVSIAFMAFSGVRPQVLGNVDGLDGLCLKDLPDLEISGNKVKVKITPMKVMVPAKLSKTSNKYMTFLCTEGVEFLIAYLEQRIANGEKLSSKSPVITTSGGFNKKGKSTKNYG